MIEKIPKRLRKQQEQGSAQIDRFHLDKLVLEDIALLFYVILTIEKNFSKLFKDFRYQAFSKCPEFPETFKEDLSKILNAINPEQLEILSCFDDILEVTRYLEGNLTRLFSKLEFHKNLIYVRDIYIRKGLL